MACNLFLTLYLLLLFFIASLKSINILHSFASIGIISYVPFELLDFFVLRAAVRCFRTSSECFRHTSPSAGERFVFSLWLFLFFFCSVLMASNTRVDMPMLVSHSRSLLSVCRTNDLVFRCLIQHLFTEITDRS